MPTQAKQDQVAEISARLEDVNSVYVVDYRGLSVKKSEELRRALREADAEIKIYKNNLMKIALEQKEISGIEDILEGPTAFVFMNNDPVAPAKVLKEFAAENPVLEIKGGLGESGALSVEDIKAIADLPSQEELIAKLLGTLQNPLTQVVRVFNGPAQGLVTALHAIQDQKDSAA